MQCSVHGFFLTCLNTGTATDAAVGIKHDEFAALIDSKALLIVAIQSRCAELMFGGVVA